MPYQKSLKIPDWEKTILANIANPYSAPIWIVPKKEDASGKPKWRLVIDYCKLNEVTIDDNLPIPNIDEILEKFLSLTGYYCKFINDYTVIAKPMSKYLKKNAKINIVDPQYLESFNTQNVANAWPDSSTS